MQELWSTQLGGVFADYVDTARSAPIGATQAPLAGSQTSPAGQVTPSQGRGAHMVCWSAQALTR